MIDAAQVEVRLPTLPAGWGVVVTGALQAVSVATLRRRFPLRALGLRFEGSEPAICDARLDLAVFDGPPHGSLQNGVAAARHLHVVNFPGDLPVPDETNVGWVCPVSSAALTALGYATQRAAGPDGVVRWGR
jgi:hypothetical protein